MNETDTGYSASGERMKLRSLPMNGRSVVHDTRILDATPYRDMKIIPYCKGPGWAKTMDPYFWEYVAPDTPTTCQLCIDLAKYHKERAERLARRRLKRQQREQETNPNLELFERNKELIDEAI